MSQIIFDYDNSTIKEYEFESYKGFISAVHDSLHQKNCQGKEYMGWIDYPNRIDRSELDRIISVSDNIKGNSDTFIIIGIGGSYLGARAAIEFLQHTFLNVLDDNKRKSPKIFFAGNNISSSYLKHLIEVIESSNVCLCVISKSGTTTEPAIAFRVLKKHLENKYGKQAAAKRIVAITDEKKGVLRKLSDSEGYETFVIPDDVGGRYSVLTPVGLLPMAAAGIDILSVLEGAKDAAAEYSSPKLHDNPCYDYAVARNILNRKGKDIEVLACFEPSFQYFAEWWKQLFGESEGKDGKGIFPASVQFSTDLHSMGQLLQDGRRNLFETFINIEKPKEDITIEEESDDIDGLNYLAGKTIDYVNKKAMEGTIAAHRDGGVPVLRINIAKADEYNFGKLVYFFQKACAVSANILGVNAFLQPGVDQYKKNMFALLGKI